MELRGPLQKFLERNTDASVTKIQMKIKVESQRRISVILPMMKLNMSTGQLLKPRLKTSTSVKGHDTLAVAVAHQPKTLEKYLNLATMKALNLTQNLMTVNLKTLPLVVTLVSGLYH
jgi:hypothetical protein